MTTPPSTASDASFWQRQNSVCPQLDHPQMQSCPQRPSHPNFEIFVASPAGKPLYHFAYNETNPSHPNYNPSIPPRPLQSITSLSATLTAFQEATKNRVSIINTGLSTCLSYVHHALHVVLVSQQRPAPNLFLQSLIRITVAAIQFCLSQSLNDFLLKYPAARPSLSSVHPLLKVTLLDAVSHPLPYALLKPVVLSSTSMPSSRRQIAQLISQLIQSHTDISHAVMFTTGPPFPTRVVVSCSPIRAELSPLDLLLLACWPYQKSEPTTTTTKNTKNTTNLNSDSTTATTSDSTSGQKIYPQAMNFRKGAYIQSRDLQLRLHPDHYETFKKAVGGQSWRPEWTCNPPHTVRLVTLASSTSSAIRFLDAVEDVLDRAAPVTNLLISMERPLSVGALSIHGVRDVIVLHDDKRLAGSLGSLCYTESMATLATLQNARAACSGSVLSAGINAAYATTDKRAFVQKFQKWNMRVIYWDSRLVVLFDLDNPADDEKAVHVCRDIFMPQLEPVLHFIVPEDERAVVPPKTPLAGFLAPFIS